MSSRMLEADTQTSGTEVHCTSGCFSGRSLPEAISTSLEMVKVCIGPSIFGPVFVCLYI